MGNKEVFSAFSQRLYKFPLLAGTASIFKDVVYLFLFSPSHPPWPCIFDISARYSTRWLDSPTHQSVAIGSKYSIKKSTD